MQPRTSSRYLFTSESVTEGHPDKICDQISDAILDAILARDPAGRVAVETLVATGLVVIAGQITTKIYVDIPKVARRTIREIGYDNHDYGFHWEDCGVLVSIDEQSPDIAQGVNVRKGKAKKGLGAGDQGLMFGYATNETPEYMPLPIVLAHALARKLAAVRKSGKLPYLRPDGKTEVTVEYRDNQPYRLENVVIGAQHDESASSERIRRDVIRHVVTPVCRRFLDNRTKLYVNATGRFVKGGPPADTGLTGRKIIVDTYGGHGSHGGGCFSGKDPTKVDRSGSYAARYVAKNIVAAGLADKCELQIAYVIGVPDPISIHVDTKGTTKIAEERILRLIEKNFDLTPSGIIDQLKLRRPIYRKTAAYGHFGRTEKDFTWEWTDKAKLLRQAL